MSPTMEVPKRTHTQDPASTPARSAEGMHACPNCASIWSSRSTGTSRATGYWHVDLRCPECEWWGRGIYAQSEVEPTTRSWTAAAGADRGPSSLTRANMEEEADRFAMALPSDRILPEDF